MIPLASFGRTIRAKITLAALLPLLVTMVVVTFLGSYLIDAWIVGEAQKKVRRDLESARVEYDRQGEMVLDILWDAARIGIPDSASAPISRGFALQPLKNALNRDSIDFMTLTDAGGQVVARGAGEDLSGPPQEIAPYIEAALAGESLVAKIGRAHV